MSQTDRPMLSPLPRELVAHVTRRIGLRMKPRDLVRLEEAVRQRMEHLGIASMDAYYRLLRGGDRAGGESAEPADSGGRGGEAEELAQALTINESYFFRDRDQIELMRHRILPELIHRHRYDRRLRFWSAGCATGEEVYSLAILVRETIPDFRAWDIRILGTDIQRRCIEQAQQGWYGAWSFRTASETFPSRHFLPREEGWQVPDELLALAEFRVGNLVADPSPVPPGGREPGFDLITCRNVLIYFEPETAREVGCKLADALRPGGLLLTAQTELRAVADCGLVLEVHPGSVVYRKPERSPGTEDPEGRSCSDFVTRAEVRLSHGPLPSGEAAFATRTGAAPADRPAGPDALVEARHLLRTGEHRVALQRMQELLLAGPRRYEALLVAAQASANLGNLTEAGRYCEEALAVRGGSALPYHLLAQIAEEGGHRETARSYLQRALEADPGFAASCLELAALYDQDLAFDKARTLRRRAHRRLLQLSPSQEVEALEPTTAGELLAQLEEAGFDSDA